MAALAGTHVTGNTLPPLRFIKFGTCNKKYEDKKNITQYK
jgi:hypothetical protein